ncbi:hypothetical protein [Chondromyces crocatus]|uniref:Uncharacterized protein n=1 Tax=Chondromyces crocatus TaxID=52 RepID=A0A0K1EH14_CHOCO|nr:hypothetical protein [Chondromyces crocatus]AKT40151.1 uncharacterized protein CMC5_043040 [Chondromyces crocatus]
MDVRADPAKRRVERGGSWVAVVLALVAAALALTGCQHDWDAYDPRGGEAIDATTGSLGMGGGGGEPHATGGGGSGGSPGVGGGGGSGGSPTCPGGHVPLVDDFDGPNLSLDWVAGIGLPASIAIADGALKVTLPDREAINMYGGVRSSAVYDLTGCSVFARVDRVTSANTHAFTQIYATAGDDVGFIEIVQMAGRLVFKQVIGNVNEELKSIPYSPTLHAYWRLREAGGMSYWETSPDGHAWVIQHRAPNPVSLGSIRVGLGAGIYQVEPSYPGEAHFGSVNVAP